MLIANEQFTPKTWCGSIGALPSYLTGQDEGHLHREEAAMWKPWTWKSIGHQVALRNARHASAALAQRRLEREEVEAYLAALPRRRSGIPA